MKEVVVGNTIIDDCNPGRGNSHGRGRHWVSNYTVHFNYFGCWNNVTLSKKLVHSYGFKFGLTALGIAKGVLLARLLGPTGRGAFALATVVQSSALRLSSLGQSTAVIRFSSRQPEALERIYYNCLWQGVVVGTAAAALAATVCMLFPSSLPLESTLLLAATCAIPLLLIYDLVRGLLLGKQDVAAFNRFELVGQMVSVSVFGAFGTWSTVHASTAVILAQILPAVIALGLVIRELGLRLVPLQRFDWSLAESMFPFGMRAGIVSALAFGVSEINVILVSRELGMEDVGFYALAQRATVSFGALTLPLTQILLPHLSATNLENEPEENWRLIRRSLVGVALMSAAVCTVLTMVIRPFITILYGREFLPAAFPCLIMAASQVFETMTSVLMAYLASAGFPPPVIKVLLLSLVAEVVLSHQLIQAYQVNGAAISYFLVQFGTSVALYYFARRSRI